MADVYEAIANAADKYGVPVEALLAIAKIESNFQAGADNPNSSASGLFQFTDGTAGGLGLTGSKRNDIEAQAEAAAKMAASNSRSLTSALGRPPTAGELYLAHQQGLSGAKALLANPNLPASEVLARFHGNNAARVITQNGGNLNMTAGEFASQWVDKGNKTAGLFPPGEIPRVGSVLSTAPAPRLPPAPVTPSIDMAQMRRISAPSQLIPDTFAGLSKGKRYLSDEIGMSPVGGGKQTAPMFDAAYDERLGAMQLTQQPINSQGMAVGASKAPPPVPKMMSPQMAGLRARNAAPEVTAALNARYPAQLPPLPPSSGIGAPPVTRPVQSVSVKVPPVPASVEERATARNRPIWQAQTKAETARLASLYANGGPTRPNAPSMSNGVGAGANVDRQRLEQIATRPRNAQVNRLPATAGIDYDANPAFSQPTQSGGLSRDALIRQRQYAANQLNPPLATPPMVAAPRVSLPNATQLATATGFRVPQPMAPGMPPLPIPRPIGVATQLSVKPVPPMPIPRPLNGLPQTAPSGTIKLGADGKTYQFGSNGQWMTTTMTPTPMGMGGAERPAPRPATMSPWLAFQRSLPALPTLRPPTSPAAQKVWMTGFSDSGSSGGAHGGSESDKHRGEAYDPNVRNMK